MAAQAVLNSQIWRWFSLGEHQAASHNISSATPSSSSSFIDSPPASSASNTGYWASATNAAFSKIHASGWSFKLDFWNSDAFHSHFGGGAAGSGSGAAGAAGSAEDWAQYPCRAVNCTCVECGRLIFKREAALGTFVTSWYCLALVIIAFVVNRIHHVVPLARRRNFRLEPGVRIGLRLPALFLLGKSVALVLSKAAYNPANDNRWTWLGQKVLRDASSVPDAAVMWSVFISLAVSCLAEALVRALNNDPRHHPSFNLLSVSYLLHFHSTPQSRPFLKPTPLIYVLISFTLAEVWALQFIDTFKLRIRLVVTAFFAIFGQSALLYCLWKVTHSDLDPMSLNALLPALRHLTRLSELFFFAVSVITVAIHALAQLIVDGRINTEIFGSTARLPSWDDDFSLAVIVYGAACLETTHASGLSNEVAPVLAAHSSRHHQHHNPLAPYIEMGRLEPRTTEDGSVFLLDKSNRSLPAGQLQGFKTEIKDIRAAAMHAEQAPDDMSRTSSLVREAGRFLVALGNVLLDIVRLGGLALSRRCRPLGRRAAGDGRIARGLRFLGVRHPSELRRARQAQQEAAAAAAFDGEGEESDADDGDFELDEEASSDGDGSSSTESSGSGSEDEEDDDLGREDSFTLYTDFMDQHQQAQGLSDSVEASGSSSRPEELNQVMLAHMASPAHQRLTRRQFQQLRGQIGTPSHVASGSLEEPVAMNDNLETQLVCIVCRTDARCIICWPCRCLSLCEGCKDVLASKAQSSGSCPSCRQTVQGFSRIFVA